MNVTIASTYAENTWHLYEAQRQFIAATTPTARHVIVSAFRPPFDCDWLPAPEMLQGKHSRQHALGLQACLRCIGGTGMAVLCDSDAFPVARNWPETIMRCLHDTRNAFAAPLRAEIGDCFPHVSFLAFPCRSVSLVAKHFQVANGRTIFGTSRPDTAASLPLHRCFPLLRSNRVNPHPWLHAIYGDIAYHRGRGTHPWYPGRAQDYWKRLVSVPEPANPQTAEAMVAFVNLLLAEPRFLFTNNKVMLNDYAATATS